MKLSRDLLIIVALTIASVLASAFPFYPLRSLFEMRDMLADFLAYDIEPPIYRTLLERIILIFPIGFFLGRLTRDLPLSRQLLVLILGSFLFCFGLEATQLPIEGRHARSSDALLAMTCMTVGYALAARLYHRSTKRMRVLIVAAAISPSILAMSAWAVGTSMLNWSGRYPILMGDELNGGRPWEGEISGIAIYPDGLSAAQIAQAAKLPFDTAHAQQREAGGALWVYSGEDAQGNPVSPLSFPGPEIPAAANMPPDLGQRLSARVKASNRLTVELKIKSAHLVQHGPARILSNSISPLLRNFTVSQHETRFDFRLRTFSSGANGTGFALDTHNDRISTQWQHFVAQYDRGKASLFLDGQKDVGPYAFDRFWGWNRQVFAPTLVLITAFGFAALAFASTFMPWMRRARL